MKKPIFTDEYVAFSAFDRHALRALIRKIDKPFKHILEVGSWTGNGSTKIIIEEIRNGKGILYCVDHWRGNTNVSRHQELVSRYDMFGTFRTNVSLYGGDEVVKSLVMSSRDAAKIIRDGAFDLVFIDGSHAYDDTILDIDLWLPKIAIDGTLCGHDCEAQAESFNKDYLWENRNGDTVKGDDFFPRIHPGVILAVNEKFGKSAHLWAEDTITLEDGTLGRSTIWDIKVCEVRARPDLAPGVFGSGLTRLRARLPPSPEGRTSHVRTNPSHLTHPPTRRADVQANHVNKPIIHFRKQRGGREMTTHSDPRFFLVTTPGLSATRWLSFVLASHEDVFVAHGKHSLISVIQGDFTREKRADDVESFTKGNELKDFYASRSVNEVFEVYQAIMPGARAYGNVHSYTIETLMKAVKSEQNLAGIQILNLLRHPVNYIDSHYSMVRSAEKHPELYHHYKEVMFKEAMEQYPELVLMENFDSKELPAFAVSCLSVCNQTKDFAFPQFKHIQMEKITTDVVALKETCEALTGLVYSTTELETFIKQGSINSHRKKSSSLHPEEVYTSWTNWQQDIAHMMLPADVLDKFDENGYDISMLKMPGREIIQEAVLDDKSVETTASLPTRPSHGVFDYREALISIASSLLQAGQTEEALFHLQRLVANYPDSADAHCRLGEGLVHGDKTDEAAQAFERAIALHPHHAPAYANLATIKQSDGQDNEAIDLLRTLTELTPNDVSAHNNLGQILYRAGKVELAEAAFLKAYQLDPNSAEVHNSLSVLYWEGGSAEKAVKHMQQALQLDPQNPDAVVNYALMQEAVGETEEAIQLLEGYLATHEDESIQQELKRMRHTGNPEDENFTPGKGQEVSKSETPAFTSHV
ncbi:tetratricopeptide repeat protein [Candidatus Poribacteria bacterium]|nr:tetratricopeptide repeat protein [Candidatus Poribacteria bacterium]